MYELATRGCHCDRHTPWGWSRHETTCLFTGWRQTLGDNRAYPARDLFLSAVESSRSNKVDKAIEQFESGFNHLRSGKNIIRDEMTLAKFSFKLAHLYHQRRGPQKTLEELQRTLRYDSWHPRALLNSGILYDQMGNRAMTIENFKRLIIGYPNHPKLTEIRKRLKILTNTVSDKISKNSSSLMWGPSL